MMMVNSSPTTITSSDAKGINSSSSLGLEPSGNISLLSNHFNNLINYELIKFLKKQYYCWLSLETS